MKEPAVASALAGYTAQRQTARVDEIAARLKAPRKVKPRKSFASPRDALLEMLEARGFMRCGLSILNAIRVHFPDFEDERELLASLASEGLIHQRGTWVYYGPAAERTMCAAMVRWGAVGLIEPRKCAKAATHGRFCGTHAKIGDRAFVTAADGGWCVWCGEPARRYNSSRDKTVTISLCGECGKALARAIR